MTLLFATDFSEAAERSLRVAAQLAKARRMRLVLMHVVPEAVPGLEESDRATAARAAEMLERLASGLGDADSVIIRVERGAPWVKIPEAAAALGAELIAVALSGRGPGRWVFGSTADRIAAVSEVPILGVHQGMRIDEWLSGARPLEVMIASDISPITGEAIRWARTLTRWGPCRFTLLHVAWPDEAYHRLGIEGPLSLDRTHPAVESMIERELARAAERLREAGPCEIVVEPPARKAADAIVRIAGERDIDLLVVGHQPSRGWRTWEGSVARRVIRLAPTSVACVPALERVDARACPDARTFLAATDLSAAGNCAVAGALSLVPPGGRVTILHVVEEPEIDPARRQRIVDGLRSLAVDRRLTERRIDVRFELVEDEAPAAAIGRIAEREGADLICIASHGRSRLPRFLLGAVAQEVLLTSRLPVLVVPPQE